MSHDISVQQLLSDLAETFRTFGAVPCRHLLAQESGAILWRKSFDAATREEFHGIKDQALAWLHAPLPHKGQAFVTERELIVQEKRGEWEAFVEARRVAAALVGLCEGKIWILDHPECEGSRQSAGIRDGLTRPSIDRLVQFVDEKIAHVTKHGGCRGHEAEIAAAVEIVCGFEFGNALSLEARNFFEEMVSHEEVIRVLECARKLTFLNTVPGWMFSADRTPEHLMDLLIRLAVDNFFSRTWWLRG